MCLQACEDEYKQQLAENRVTDDVKFTYSWHLIKSQYKNDIKKGIRLMDGKSGRGGEGGRWGEGTWRGERQGEEREDMLMFTDVQYSLNISLQMLHSFSLDRAQFSPLSQLVPPTTQIL